MNPVRLRLPSSGLRPLSSVLCAAALLFTACTTPAPAQQALKVDPDTGQLVEPTTLQIGSGQTFTVASNATITLPDNALAIADTSGLQTALDAKAEKSSNLSDLASASTARTNLGLGTAATRDVGQDAGNVLELSAAGTVELGGSVGGAVRLWDSAAGSFSLIDITDGALCVTNFNGSQLQLVGPLTANLFASVSAYGITDSRTYTLPDSSGTLALTSDITAANLTGTVTVAKGGTGRTTLTSGSLLTGNATGPLTLIAPGTSGNVLTSNGTAWLSTAPSGGGGGNITINTTSPLTVNGNSTATTSNATLAISTATPAQAVAGTSTTLPVPPESLLLALMNSGLRTSTFTVGTTTQTGSGTGTLDVGIANRVAVTNLTAGTIVRRNMFSFGAMSNLGAAQVGINWGKPWSFSARLYPALTWSAGNRGLICIRKDRTQGFGLVGTTAFFFIELDNLVLKAGYWNGSAATRTSTLATLATDTVAEVILIGNGAGGLSVYLNGALATTLSSVPTNNVQSIEPADTMELENTGGGAGAWFYVAHPIKFWSYN